MINLQQGQDVAENEDLVVYDATGAFASNFFGNEAGSGATGSSYSNFLGANAGVSATNAGLSNFLGYAAGQNATYANSSNFFGPSAGASATSAYYSSFIGSNAGAGAANAARSIFIGYYAGTNDTVDNRFGSPSSILIGNNTSTGGYSNSIAMGRSAVNTATNQFMIGSSTSPINTLRINGSAATECTITSGTGIACTSDERVKTNIVDLNTNTLDALLNIRTVSYNWLGNPTGKQQIGFLAQDLEQYFPQLVETDTDGMKSVYYAQMTPILVESLRELNIKVTDLQKVADGVDVTFITNLKNWLGNQANGITAIYADLFQSKKIQTDELCVGAVCVTQQQFMNVFGNSAAPQSSGGPVIGDSSTDTSATTTGATSTDSGTLSGPSSDPTSTDSGASAEEPDPVIDSTVTPPETPSEITP
jgi:hypothetical protein